jgi:hypothetical protein
MLNSKYNNIVAIAAACAIMMMATVPMWTAAANTISSNNTDVASEGTAIAAGRACCNYLNDTVIMPFEINATGPSTEGKLPSHYLT